MTQTSSETAAIRRVILVLAAAGFASTFAGRTVDPMVTVIAADLESHPKTIALLATAFALPFALVQPILGPMGDALGKLRVMRSCLVVLAVSLVASAFVTDATALFALRVVSGAAAGGVVPLSLATLGDQVALERRQVAISRFLVALIAGQLLGAAAGGALAELMGWRGVLLLCSVLVALSVGAVLLGAPPPTRPPTALSLPVAVARYRKLLANPRALALFSFVFTEGFAIFGIFPFIAPLMEAEGTGGPTEAGLALSFFAVGGLVFSALIAWMLRALGARWILVGGGFICAMGLLVIGLAQDWRVYALATLAIGLGYYMLHNTFQVNVTELVPDARASAVALHACSFFLGAAAGPVLTGLGLAWLGRFPTMLLSALAIAALGVVASRVLTGRRA